MKRGYINPKTLPDWSSMVTQVVVTEKNGLKFIHISGQVGVDPAKKVVGNGSIEAQTRQALINLQAAYLCSKLPLPASFSHPRGIAAGFPKRWRYLN